jgi:hypothetical protein
MWPVNCFIFIYKPTYRPYSEARLARETIEVALPRAGKVIGCVIVSTKIATFRDLGSCKHNESIQVGEKLASVCFKLRDTIHERDK